MQARPVLCHLFYSTATGGHSDAMTTIKRISKSRGSRDSKAGLNRRALLGGVAGALAAPAIVRAAAVRPNVVLVLSDDQS